MPNQNNSMDSLEKQTQRASEGASKVIDGARDAAAAATKHATDRMENAVRGAVSGAKEALSDVTQEASALLHNAQDVAADSYDSARGYALEVAHDASDLAQRASERTVRYVREASTATGKFATVHALPLVAVGASLGWLAWSVRRNSQGSGLGRMPRTPRLTATLEARRPLAQEQRESRASRVAPTTSGAKLMGVNSNEGRNQH